MIVLLFQSLIALTQTDSLNKLNAWIGPDGSVCMTAERAAVLLNAEDSLVILYELNLLNETVLLDYRNIVSTSKESLKNLLNQKQELERKIAEFEERLNIKSDKVIILEQEVSEKSILLIETEKKFKRQKTLTIVTSTIGGVALITTIASIIIIAI